MTNAVQAVVWAAAEPLSTAEVDAKVQPSCGRETVWNALRRLESLGLVRKQIRMERVRCWNGDRCRTGPVAYWSRA